MSFTSELLTLIVDAEIRDGDGGFLIKEEDGVQVVILTNMIYSFRIVRTDGPFGYDRAWCYYGKDLTTLIKATRAALAWDMADDTAPEGWDKNAMTGEYSGAR